MKTIQWGIIGCGNVTEVKSGPAFNKVPGSKLVAVMRRNEQKVKDYAQRHGVSKWYTSAEKLINDPEVNAVYIATPPVNHEEYTMLAIRAQKPVYVEKPMTMNAASAQRMTEEAKARQVKLSIAHYRRMQPIFLKIKSLLEEGAIGKPMFINLQMLQPHNSSVIAPSEENWRIDPSISGGGLFHDLAPHQLDLMIYFFGEPLESKGISLNQGGFYQAADFVSGTIQFADNLLFRGLWSFAVPEKEKSDRCEIIGERGSIRFSIFENQPIVLSTEDAEESFHFDALEHVQQPMIQRVVEYFSGLAENPCSGEEGVKVMRIMDSFGGL